MKKYGSLSEVKSDYEKKQAEKPETTLVPHSQKYHDRVKAEKKPPSAGEKE